MKGSNWLWTVIVAAVLVLGGGSFAVGWLMGQDGEERSESPTVHFHELNPIERERQEIAIAAGEGEIVEATLTPDGWIVRVEEEAIQIQPDELLVAARRFFQNLERAEISIIQSSYEARTNQLKDVWGNRLERVPLVRIALSGETHSKVNWRGFDPKNFPRIADDFWVHDIVGAMMAAMDGGGMQSADEGSSSGSQEGEDESSEQGQGM